MTVQADEQQAANIARAMELQAQKVKAAARNEEQAAEILLKNLSDMFNSSPEEQARAIAAYEAFRRGE